MHWKLCIANTGTDADFLSRGGHPETNGGIWTKIHPSPKVMADFFRHKNQHDTLIQFAQLLVDLWNVC